MVEDNFIGPFSFTGLVFWGGSLLPRDVLLDLDHIREWATDTGLIFDKDQFISQETVDDVARLFTTGDRLSVVVHLYWDASAALCYIEYPYVPVATLIKRQLQVDLVYWNMLTSSVRFGFWVQGSSLEMASESTGPMVVSKFKRQFEQVSVRYPTSAVRDGEQEDGMEISGIDGAVKANFFKSGRAYDVKFAENAP